MPGQIKLLDSFLHSRSPAFRHGNHAIKSLFGQHLGQAGAHRCQGQRISCKSSTDASSVTIFQIVMSLNMVGNKLCKPISRAGDSTGDRLPEHQKIGFKFFCLCVPAGPGTDGVGFINDKGCVIFLRELAQSFVDIADQDAQSQRSSSPAPPVRKLHL